MMQGKLSFRLLALAAIGGCAASAAHTSAVRDARGRFLDDTLVIAPPAYGMYAGTTVPLDGDVWRRGMRSPDSTAAIHWSVGDVERGWVTETGTLVLLKPGRITLVAESGTLRTERSIEIEENPVDRVELVPSHTVDAQPADTVRFIARLTTDSETPLPDARVHYAIASRGMGTEPGATIDDSGRFVAERPGLYTVVAAVGDIAAHATVVVPGAVAGEQGQPVRDLRIEEPDDQPYTGTFTVLRTTGRSGPGDERRPVPSPIWSSSDSTIAMVTENGVVSFLDDGRVTIAAEAGGARAERRFAVRREAAAHMALRVDARDITTGEPVPLREQLWQKGGMPIRDARVNYGIVVHDRELPPDAARITEDRRFIARWPGVYTIIAELGGVSDQATIVVREKEALARPPR